MGKELNKVQMAKIEAIFRKAGGLLRATEAIRKGIHPVTLYALRDNGVIEAISRGVYRLSSIEPSENLDVVAAAKRVPHGVICLISALAFHDLTTQIPREVYMALRKGVRKPTIDFPPIRFFWLSKKVFESEIESHTISATKVQIYSAEKTVADAFKFRNTIGLDVALEALKRWRSKKRPNVEHLLALARICRVEKVIKPYLEAIL